LQSPRGFQRSEVPSSGLSRGALTPQGPGSLSATIEAFLLSRAVGGCTSRTGALYRLTLRRLIASLGDDLQACTALAVQG
jgi:hypothetical protein